MAVGIGLVSDTSWEVISRQVGKTVGTDIYLQVICQAALACRRELETALPVICLQWQSVEKGERNTGSL